MTHLHLVEMPRTHQCHMCQKILSRSTILREHLRAHADERPYPCQRCGRALTRRWDQRQHERTHTVAYKFSCGDGKGNMGCDKMFHRKRDLRRHCGSARCRNMTEEIDVIEEPSGPMVRSSSDSSSAFTHNASGLKALLPQLTGILPPATPICNTSFGNTDGRLPYGIDDTRRVLLHHFKSTRAQDLLVDDRTGVDLFTVMVRQTIYHPAVRHSLAAIVLLCSEIASHGGPSQPVKTSLWPRHYSLAMKAMQESLTDIRGQAQLDALLTAAMNFSSIESLMGNLCRAFLHLKGASCMLEVETGPTNEAHHDVLRQYLSKTVVIHRECEAKKQHFLGPLDHSCSACQSA